MVDDRGKAPITIAKTVLLGSNREAIDGKAEVGIVFSRVELVLVYKDKVDDGR